MKFRQRLVLTLLSLVMAAGAAAQETDKSLELAQRLLGPWGGAAGYSTELKPGELPSQLIDPLPLPSSVEVVGSLVNLDAEGEMMFAQVVLDSELEPQAAVDELSSAFRDEGWTVQPQGEATGFLPAYPHVTTLYCSASGSTYVYVNAFSTSGGETDLRLEVNTQQFYSPCGEGGTQPPEPPFVPIPGLPAPTGSRVDLHGGTYLETEASSSAMIHTEMPGDELVLHYQRHLENAGWERVDEGDGDRGRSSWFLRRGGSNWRGMLNIVEPVPGQAIYFATFVVLQSDD